MLIKEKNEENEISKYGNIMVSEKYKMWFWNPGDSFIVIFVPSYYTFLTGILSILFSNHF